jgi:hypothetical protein
MKRAEINGRRFHEETTTCESPRDVEARQRHSELVDYYYNLHEQQKQREEAEKIAAATKRLYALKADYIASRSDVERSNIVREYVQVGRIQPESNAANVTWVIKTLDAARKAAIYQRMGLL